MKSSISFLKTVNRRTNVILNLCIVVLIIFNISSVLAQDISKLDDLHGFKDFKIGDSLYKWKNDLSNIQYSYLDSTTTAAYTGNCCKTAFYKELELIQLEFDKNLKLVTIFASFKEPVKDIDPILNEYIRLFGKNNYGSSDDKTMNLQAVWLADKTLLVVFFDFDDSLFAWKVRFMVQEMNEEKRKKHFGTDF